MIRLRLLFVFSSVALVPIAGFAEDQAGDMVGFKADEMAMMAAGAMGGENPDQLIEIGKNAFAGFDVEEMAALGEIEGLSEITESSAIEAQEVFVGALEEGKSPDEAMEMATEAAGDMMLEMGAPSEAVETMVGVAVAGFAAAMEEGLDPENAFNLSGAMVEAIVDGPGPHGEDGPGAHGESGPGYHGEGGPGAHGEDGPGSDGD